MRKTEDNHLPVNESALFFMVTLFKTENTYTPAHKNGLNTAQNALTCNARLCNMHDYGQDV